MTKINPLLDLFSRKKEGNVNVGVFSVCSADRYVISAAIKKAKEKQSLLLIEATSNQVNQYGGYTGMNPLDFVKYVKEISAENNFPFENIILGGDHLGPLPWVTDKNNEAMQKAEELIRQFVLAGFSKIHFDTTMLLKEDGVEFLDELTISKRSVRLVKAAEESFVKLKKRDPDATPLVYVIGSEVPTAGGNKGKEVEVTTSKDFLKTVNGFQKIFKEEGLEDALKRIIAVVVQPGVEFGNNFIKEYNRKKATSLMNSLKLFPNLVFEGHSTDYQSPEKLKEMVGDGICILKVGPELTFKMREAIYSLELLEKELSLGKEMILSYFSNILERVMVENPDYWKDYYYEGSYSLSFLRKYSFLDRARYYLNYPKVRNALNVLIKNLSNIEVPLEIANQFPGIIYKKTENGALRIDAIGTIEDGIGKVLDKYFYAINYEKMPKNYLNIDAKKIPKKELYNGDMIPTIGLGTFGSDRFSNKDIATAVKDAILRGYRHIDCASVYGNEKEIGEALKEVMEKNIERKELWITSKVWNDMHGDGDVIRACKQSLKDLQLDYLDLYLVHWPFPNYHSPGCDINSRDPNSKPYAHEDFMRVWRQMEELVRMGLVRNIGTSNMTVPKLNLLLRDSKIKPAVNEMEIHPHFQQEKLFNFCVENKIQPIAFSPIGSPTRPDRDTSPEDTVDIEDPVIKKIAKRLNVHPAVVCIKWAIQRGQIPIPFSIYRNEYMSNLLAAVSPPLTDGEMEEIKTIDKNCRLIKGQVFLWKENQDWRDLWDEDGYIVDGERKKDVVKGYKEIAFKLASELREKFNDIVGISISGSFPNGDADEYSDIDLDIWLPKNIYQEWIRDCPLMKHFKKYGIKRETPMNFSFGVDEEYKFDVTILSLNEVKEEEWKIEQKANRKNSIIIFDSDKKIETILKEKTKVVENKFGNKEKYSSTAPNDPSYYYFYISAYLNYHVPVAIARKKYEQAHLNLSWAMNLLLELLWIKNNSFYPYVKSRWFVVDKFFNEKQKLIIKEAQIIKEYSKEDVNRRRKVLRELYNSFGYKEVSFYHEKIDLS